MDLNVSIQDNGGISSYKKHTPSVSVENDSKPSNKQSYEQFPGRSGGYRSPKNKGNNSNKEGHFRHGKSNMGDFAYIYNRGNSEFSYNSKNHSKTKGNSGYYTNNRRNLGHTSNSANSVYYNKTGGNSGYRCDREILEQRSNNTESSGMNRYISGPHNQKKAFETNSNRGISESFGTSKGISKPLNYKKPFESNGNGGISGPHCKNGNSSEAYSNRVNSRNADARSSIIAHYNSPSSSQEHAQHDSCANRPPNYKNFDSYISQKNHDVGDGRFWRDAKDLPPRFQKMYAGHLDQLVKFAKENGVNIDLDNLSKGNTDCTSYILKERSFNSECDATDDCMQQILPVSGCLPGKYDQEISAHYCQDAEPIQAPVSIRTFPGTNGFSGKKLSKEMSMKSQKPGYHSQRNELSCDKGFQSFGIAGNPISEQVMLQNNHRKNEKLNHFSEPNTFSDIKCYNNPLNESADNSRDKGFHSLGIGGNPISEQIMLTNNNRKNEKLDNSGEPNKVADIKCYNNPLNESAVNVPSPNHVFVTTSPFGGTSHSRGKCISESTGSTVTGIIQSKFEKSSYRNCHSDNVKGFQGINNSWNDKKYSNEKHKNIFPTASKCDSYQTISGKRDASSVTGESNSKKVASVEMNCVNICKSPPQLTHEQISSFERDSIYVSNIERGNDAFKKQSCNKNISSSDKIIRRDSNFSRGNETKSLQSECASMPQVIFHGQRKVLIKVDVSRDVENIGYWAAFMKELLHHDKFEVEVYCSFTKTLSVKFLHHQIAKRAATTLKKVFRKDNGSPFIIRATDPRWEKMTRDPQRTQEKVMQNFLKEIDKLYEHALATYSEKIRVIETEVNNTFVKNHDELDDVDYSIKLTKQEKLKELNEMKIVFQKSVDCIKLEAKDMSFRDGSFDRMKELKKNCCHECNYFKACLPIYAKRYKILDLVHQNQVSVLTAETGSGKSTQIVQYLYKDGFAKDGVIVCTQPRKIAAISIARYISGIMGSPVGGIAGYEAGITTKVGKHTKIIYMTDYSLLRKCVRNENLDGISCVVVDEAHERTINTDLLLGIIKKCLPKRPDLKVIITSATIDPEVFQEYFKLSAASILTVPGRMYPVSVVWQDFDSFVGSNYLENCVKMAFKVHEENEKGNILAFLTSPYETEEAVTLFKGYLRKNNHQSSPNLLCFHGKQSVGDQMDIFANDSKCSRKIIFATNSAETSVTIPGIKFVIDSGMVKEMQYHSKKNQNTLVVSFINKSSAEQRKGRAGRTEPGICYRLYSKHNYDEMPDRMQPEILRFNIQLALLKILEFGIQPQEFDFIESPAKESISSAMQSLEFLGAIKDNKFTDLGQKITKLPLEPQLSKLALCGIKHGVGYEAVVIASLVSVSGMVFYRNDENRAEADEKITLFCQEQGDFLTFLNVYQRWMKIREVKKSQWCIDHCVNAKGMRIARQTTEELINILRFDNILFKKVFKPLQEFQSKCEKLIFECFSENLCIYSGHKKTGYLSPFQPGTFFLHPSSSVCYLRDGEPLYVVSSTVMKTSRNFLLNITPVQESTIIAAHQKGEFLFQIDMLRSLKLNSLRIWPVGGSVLIKNILGKQGCKVRVIEERIRAFSKSDSFHIEVNVENSEILVHIEQQYWDLTLQLFNSIIQESQFLMAQEEDVCSIANCVSSSFAVGCGGVVSDVILPDEFRELEIECIGKSWNAEETIKVAQEYGTLLSSKVYENRGKPYLLATYVKVSAAQNAMLNLQKSRCFKVKRRVPYSNILDKSLPLFCLQVRWSRLPGTGTGWIKFCKLEDCIEASGILTMHSISLQDKFIMVTPTNKNERELFMRNLPTSAKEEDIMIALRNHLPEYLTIKQVVIDYPKNLRSSEGEISSSKAQLFNLFSKYTPSSKLLIDLKTPSPRDTEWNAQVYFMNFEDGEKALSGLKDKAKIGVHQIQIRPLFKAKLRCEKQIYKAVEKSINTIMKHSKSLAICLDFDVLPINKAPAVLITFTCNTIGNLLKIRQAVIDLIHGQRINCSDKAGYHKLFSRSGQNFLQQVQEETRSFVVSDSVRKLIFLYGSENACSLARSQIDCYAAVSSDGETRTFNLGSKKMPLGFIKALRNRYGAKLYLLVDEFSLRSADIDVLNRRLIVEGSSKKIKLVEECLATLCLELSQSSKSVSSKDKETCPICFDICTDFYRLENCCHAYCKQCLLLQIESKIFPLICTKEDCGKPFFIEDLRKLFFGCDDLKWEFYDRALKDFVSKNSSEVRYCPVPDCRMVYRVNSTNPEISCSMCENDICTRCHDLYHHGMSCDMFQKTKVDKDHSLKVWLSKDPNNRKICPKCSSAIEKFEGCDHMLCNHCNSHLCWRCLKTFSTSDEVYEHLTRCYE